MSQRAAMTLRSLPEPAAFFSRWDDDEVRRATALLADARGQCCARGNACHAIHMGLYPALALRLPVVGEQWGAHHLCAVCLHRLEVDGLGMQPHVTTRLNGSASHAMHTMFLTICMQRELLEPTGFVPLVQAIQALKRHWKLHTQAEANHKRRQVTTTSSQQRAPDDSQADELVRSPASPEPA